MKRKISISVKNFCDIPTSRPALPLHVARGCKLKLLLLMLFMASPILAQERKVDPTWLHRDVPHLSDVGSKMASQSCHYKSIFGEGDKEIDLMQSVARFAEVTLDASGSCQGVLYDREEEIYFVLQGSGVLQYGNVTRAMKANDFTYLAPGMKHSIANSAQQPLRVLVMGFNIPSKVSIGAPSLQPTIVNLDTVKEETVSGHPSSVLYKLLVGPRKDKRDAIDDAYVVTSFFLMDFTPGGTNFPHHHQTAEEIYLVLDGEGEMVAGSGMDGVEGRYPAKAGDAYYFRPNCTVGFYNQNKSGAKAHILAVRSKISIPADDD
jgi:mannose-6-phosphate isomerase-like protein (cupin superfamily)